jgi:hypothetical protein
VFILVILVSANGFSEKFPSQPIRIVAPMRRRDHGRSIRVFQPFAQKRGVPVVIENMVGGGGAQPDFYAS